MTCERSWAVLPSEDQEAAELGQHLGGQPLAPYAECSQLEAAALVSVEALELACEIGCRPSQLWQAYPCS